MKPRTKPLQARVDDVLPSSGPITKLNFHDRLRDFFRMYPEDCVMVRDTYEDRSEEVQATAAMADWIDYLGAKDFDKTKRFWQSQINSKKPVMLVCADPGKFDLEYRFNREAAE